MDDSSLTGERENGMGMEENYGEFERKRDFFFDFFLPFPSFLDLALFASLEAAN